MANPRSGERPSVPVDVALFTEDPLDWSASADDPPPVVDPVPVAFDPDRSRFVVRARVILLARLGLVAMVLVGLLVPAWSELLGLNSPLAAAGCALVAAYSIVALTLLDSRWAQSVVFGALCLDLVFVV